MTRWLLMAWLLLGDILTASAQETDTLRHWGGAFIANPSTVIVMDSYQRKYQQGKRNLSWGIEALYSSVPADSDAYAADYGYPTIGVGLKYSLNHGVTMHRSPDPAWGQAEEVDYRSRMGNSLSLYGSFARPLYRNRKWEVDYAFLFGVGYCAHDYDPADNVDNELIGSHWLVFFGAGLHASYRVAPAWGVKAGLEYWHLSNGALYRPNKGANFFGPSFALVYRPYYDVVSSSEAKAVAQAVRKPFQRYWIARVTAGVGAKTLNEDWQLTQFQTPPGDPDYRTGHFRLYASYSLQTDVLYRYARRWASGIGVDLFYGTYSNHVAELDTKFGGDGQTSPWSVGIAAKHEVYYHRLRLAMSIGYYLYRKMGVNAKEVEQPYYERIGIHYDIPRTPLSVGVNVKAHRTKADLTEVVLSYNFRKLEN